MRPIEFRAWDTRSKRMAFVDYLSFRTNHDVFRVQCLGDFPEDFHIENPDDRILMQFTGLLDRNGKEIWEGDIVKAFVDFGPGGEYEKIFTVTTGPWGVNLQKWTYDENILPEVIGNVYENPELMEGK